MLYLYPKNTVDFTNNGDPIHHSYDEHVIRDDGFYLTFNLLLDKEEDYKKIKKEMIISADTPDGINQFRIYDIKNKSTVVEVTAVQLMYDFDNKEVNPFSLKNSTGSQVISRFKSSFKSTLGQFTMDSSVTETHDFATNDEDDDTPSHNALEVLNRITNRWDSELMLNGFDIRMIKRLGAKTDALLYEKKNISEFEDASSVSGMVTRIHAISKFTPEGKEDEVILSVTVDSPLINEYAQIYEKSYVNNDCRTEAELIAWTKLKYSTENVDKPSRSITVSTNIIDGTEINYGDDLVLKYLVHDVDEIIRCVGYDYDPIKNTYHSVTLGDWKDSFATTLTGGIVDTTNRQINQIKSNVTQVLMSANGKNRSAYGPEPVPNPINGDMWYYFEFDRPNDVELRIFQDGFWLAIDFATKKEVEAVLDQADLDRTKAEQDFESVKQLAKQYTDAEVLKFDTKFNAETGAIRNEVTTGYNNAIADGKTYTDNKSAEFNTQLGLVKTDVANTVLKADAAVLKADKAIADVGFLKPDVATAKADAATAIQTASTATQSAATAIQNAQTALNSIATLSDEVDVSFSNINGVLATKVSQTTFNTLSGTVGTHTTQISQTQTALTAKAESSLVNTIKGTVDTHTTQIKVVSDGLELKAESSLVNTVKGTVDSHTTQINANSQAITARLTSVQIETLLTGKKYVNETTLAATSSGLTAQITQVSNDLINLDINGTNLFPLSSLRDSQSFNSFTMSDVTATLVNGDYTLLNRTSTSSTRAYFTSKSKIDMVDNFVIGDVITISYDVYIESGASTSTGAFIRFYNSSGGMISDATANISANTPTNKWVRLIGSTVIPPNTDFSRSGVLTIGISGVARIRFRNINVSKGNKDNGWTPYYGDMATLEKVVTIEANIDGINTLVATKASQTQVTQLAGQITTKVDSSTYNSKMTQLDSAINLRVVQNDVTAAILADKTVKDTRNDNQLPSWYNTNYPKQTVEEFKLRTVLGVPGGAMYGQLTTKILWNNTAGGSITQMFYSADGVFQRVSNAAYTAWLAWDKVAEAGQLISQINISTEGILLQGKRIQLDGDVTMTSAFVTRLDVLTLAAVYADIATLKTKVLTADVITSVHLKVDNAMMDKLTATTAVVNYLFTKTAFVDNLSTKTLTAITANIATIRGQVLIANAVQATHLQADAATITKLFATDANVNILTAKTAFINSVKAVDIAADRIVSGSLNAANVNIINLNASKIVSGTFTGLTFTNPYNLDGLNGNTVLKGDLTSSYSKTNGQTGSMAFSRDRVFSNLYASNGTLVTGFNLSPEALNINSQYGKATLNFDELRSDRSDGASSAITFAYSTFPMQIYSTQHTQMGISINGVRSSRIEYGGSGANAFVSIFGQLNMNGNQINVSDLVWDASSSIKRGVNSLDVRAKAIYSVSLSGFAAMYLSRDTIAGTQALDLYAKLNMQGNVITNQSDRRLKKNIFNAMQDSLGSIAQWNFVNYEWKDSNRPKGSHLGLIAQDTPEIVIYDSKDDIYSINNTKLQMMTAHGLQQLNSKVVSILTTTNASNILASQALSNSNQALSEVQQLKQEVQELKQKLNQLESVA